MLEENGSRRASGKARQSTDVSQPIDCGFADGFYEWHLDVRRPALMGSRGFAARRAQSLAFRVVDLEDFQ